LSLASAATARRAGCRGQRRAGQRRRRLRQPVFKPTGGARVVIETGEVVGRITAAKIDTAASAVRDKDAVICELEAEVRELRYELGLRPSMDDLRRIDSVARHVQKKGTGKPPLDPSVELSTI